MMRSDASRYYWYKMDARENHTPRTPPPGIKKTIFGAFGWRTLPMWPQFSLSLFLFSSWPPISCTHKGPPPPSYFKAEPLHTSPVRINRRLAVLGGVGGVGEEHALVAFVFLIEAYTAGLLGRKKESSKSVSEPIGFFWGGGLLFRTLGLVVATSPLAAAAGCANAGAAAAQKCQPERVVCVLGRRGGYSHFDACAPMSCFLLAERAGGGIGSLKKVTTATTL